MAFTVHAVMPGVWHIVDCMGVCMTLLEGENAAMLVDTGYGIEDVADFMRHMTDLPLTVFLTHNHHDHAMGARCFPETYMLEADMADWRMFTNDEMRRRVLTQAIGKNLPVDEKTFLAGEIPLPKVMKPGVIDLGGLTAEIIEAPGHTPGSAVVYVPERKLPAVRRRLEPLHMALLPAGAGASGVPQQHARHSAAAIRESPLSAPGGAL